MSKSPRFKGNNLKDKVIGLHLDNFSVRDISRYLVLDTRKIVKIIDDYYNEDKEDNN